MKVDLIWATPGIDKLVGYMARVSNKNAQPDDPATKLIKYLIDHKHWSPFEMVNICMSIHTTRDIARQILRHRSFHFQEFSQRYSEAPEEPLYSEARLQDTTNRQNSILVHDENLINEWASIQNKVWDFCWMWYKVALHFGIAKELARKLLPEGLTRTHMYMNGTLRDWIHYLTIRTGVETQKEHRDVAEAILKIVREICPAVIDAAILKEEVNNDRQPS